MAHCICMDLTVVAGRPGTMGGETHCYKSRLLRRMIVLLLTITQQEHQLLCNCL